jgi:hypothetical protein
MTNYVIKVRDRDRVPLGEVSIYTRFEAIMRLNDASTWTLIMPADVPAAALFVLREQSGIVVERDGVPVLSGNAELIQLRQTAEGDVLEVTGLDDTGRLAHHFASPSPEDTNFNFLTDYDVRTNEVSSLMYEYIYYNATLEGIVAIMGTAGATLYRRPYEGLVMEPDPVLGPVVTYSARFENLLELCRSLAIQGGSLRFKVLQDGTDLVFSVTETADVSDVARFSREMGNLPEATVIESSPAVTWAFAGGDGGEGRARTMRGALNADEDLAYGRREQFVEARAASSADELTQKAQEALAAGGAVTSVDMKPVDTEQVTWGVDYDLGDRVAVIINGTEVLGTVRECVLSITPERGADVRPVVTDVLAAERPSTLLGGPSLRTVGQRVAFLERNSEPMTGGSVVLWARPTSDLPSDWAHCNGAGGSGTFDMQGRFVVGADGSYGVGDGGGVETIADHLHTLGGHNHSFSWSGTTSDQGGDTVVVNSGSGENVTDEPHTHTYSGSGNTGNAGGNTSSAGGHDNRPPFKAMHFIQRRIFA